MSSLFNIIYLPWSSGWLTGQIADSVKFSKSFHLATVLKHALQKHLQSSLHIPFGPTFTFIFEDLQKHLQKQSSYSFWSYSFWSFVYLHFRRLAKAFVFDGGQEGKWRQLKKGKSLQWIWWGSWESQEEQTWTCTRLRRANFDFKHIVRWQKPILLRIHLKRNNLLIEAEKQIKLFDTRIEFGLTRSRSGLFLLIIQIKLK